MSLHDSHHGRVVAVHRASEHTFSKTTEDEIELVAGIGVRDDAHAGYTVQHRSRVKQDPHQPNLRQVHLIAIETLELRLSGFVVEGGDLGENITTQGINLFALTTGSLLMFEGGAEIEVTGLRNPCRQIEDFKTGLLAMVRKREDDEVVRRVGVMGIVRRGGIVRANSRVTGIFSPPGAGPLGVV
jgi:MOSC domain-containing protein YiiM